MSESSEINTARAQTLGRSTLGKSFAFPVLESINSKDFQNWLATLPISIPTKAAQQINYGLFELKQRCTDSALLFNCLSLLEQPIQTVSLGLTHFYWEQTATPLDIKNYSVELAIDIHMEIALAWHKLVLHQAQQLPTEIANITEWLAPATFLLEAANLACQHYYNAFLNSLRIYAPQPMRLWSGLHAIYALIETYHEIFQTESALQTGINQIINNYKRCLLLAIANPGQLQAPDIEGLAKISAEWVDYVQIKPISQEKILFVQCLSEDSPPAYANLLTKPLFIDHWRVLDLHILVKHLQSIVTKQSGANASLYPAHMALLTPYLLERLIHHWSEKPIRSFRRLPQTGQIVVASGLAEIHRLLSTGCISEKEPSIYSPFLNPVSPQQLSLQEWHLMNISPTGYCLCKKINLPNSIQVGELIALCNKESAGKVDWHIGVIRWAKYSSTDGLQIGIQVLAPTAVAILTQTQISVATRLALLLPKIPLLTQASSIILPPEGYQSQQVITLLDQESRRDVVLGQQITTNHCYSQFLL